MPTNERKYWITPEEYERFAVLMMDDPDEEPFWGEEEQWNADREIVGLELEDVQSLFGVPEEDLEELGDAGNTYLLEITREEGETEVGELYFFDDESEEEEAAK